MSLVRHRRDRAGRGAHLMSVMEVQREKGYEQFKRLRTTYLRDEWPDRRPLKIFA